MVDVKTLTEILANGPKKVTVSFVSTVSKMTKTGNPFAGKEVMKAGQLTGTIGKNYAEALAEIAIAEGVSAPTQKSRAWGVMGKDGLIEHKGEMYLEIFVESASQSIYSVNGKDVTNDIKPFLPKSSGSSSTQEELTQKVAVRTLNVNTITSIVIAE